MGLVPFADYEHPGLLLSQSVGPIARDARDCALVLQAVAGPDGRDVISAQQDPPDYLARLDEGVAGLRIAWTDDFGWSRHHWVEETPALTEFARSATFGLADVGAEVSETDEAWDDLRPVMFQLGAVFPGMGYSPPISADELATRAKAIDEAWGRQPDEPPTVPPDPAPVTSETYRTAAETRARNWTRFRRLFATHDVLISTTTPMQPRPLTEWGLGGRSFTMTSYSAHTGMFNVLGFPVVSVPCGFVNDLPVGIQIAGLPGREDTIPPRGASSAADVSDRRNACLGPVNARFRDPVDVVEFSGDDVNCHAI